ncbi:hypothetical protein JAAARDRAFT_480866 [Jaapia argillacea MUCL 33604]|uniref:Uncharacterized protein n=1 Tax=Jaapia argillacea MUCL 33604 TaxID=933084 RepID=A0A067PMT1_9AGAM|nr:hypothetical protein JAAARDRAFT_480866 [Jaapia argillacea MUCL 33604]
MPSPSANTDPTRPFTARVEDISALVHDLDRFGLAVEVDAGSDSTASDLVGPGRTVGKWISTAGTGFEKLVGNVAERLGMGPNAVFDRILTKLARAFAEESRLGRYELARKLGHPVVSAVAGHHSVRFLQPPRPFLSLVEGATKLSLYSTGDGMVIATAGVQADCQKLAAFLRDKNNINQYLATYYIISLICGIPDLLSAFLDNGALNFIERNCTYLASLPRRDQTRDLLLAPSQKALALFSESQVLTIINEEKKGPRPLNSNGHLERMIEYSRE